jgi:hypothetical protein
MCVRRFDVPKAGNRRRNRRRCVAPFHKSSGVSRNAWRPKFSEAQCPSGKFSAAHRLLVAALQPCAVKEDGSPRPAAADGVAEAGAVEAEGAAAEVSGRRCRQVSAWR